MKNIVFIHSCYPAGGAERVTGLIGAGLAATGEYRVTVICRQRRDEEFTDTDRSLINVVELEGDTDLIRDESNLDQLAAAIEEARADAVVMTVDPVYYADKLKERLPGCKFLFHYHGMPLWEVQVKLAGHRRRAMTSLGRRLEWFLLKAPGEYVFKRYTRRYGKLLKEVYRHVDRFIVLCDGYKGALDKVLGVSGVDSRVVAMYNPLDTAGLTPLSRQQKANEVLFVGRLSYADKRVDRLLRIWSMVEESHPDWVLKIVGTGDEEDNLKAYAAELGLQRVKFCGYTANPSAHYQTASILCLTSDNEGWGMVLVEAQAAGVWPIAFGVSAGVREIIGTDGTRGTLIKPGREKEYAARLAELMDNPERLDAARETLSRSAQKYSVETVTKRWQQLFDEIIDR